MTETAMLAERPASVGTSLLQQVATSATKEALRYLEGERWVTLTWMQTKDKVFRLAAGLLALGVESENRVAIVSGTRIEWIFADLAITCAAGAIHHGLPDHQQRGCRLHPGRLRSEDCGR